MTITSDELKNKKASELAYLQSSNHHQSEEYILAEKEWQRRERLEQHALDLKLISKQVRWMKFSILAVFAAALISSLLTYYLSKTTESTYLRLTREIFQQANHENVLSSPPETTLDHLRQKEKTNKKKSSSQPSTIKE